LEAILKAHEAVGKTTPDWSSETTILRCQRRRRTMSTVRSVAWKIDENGDAYSQPSFAIASCFCCQRHEDVASF